MSPGNSKDVQPLQACLGPVPGGPSSSFSTRTLNFPPGGEAHSQQPPTSLCSPVGCSFYKKAGLRLLPKCRWHTVRPPHFLPQSPPRDLPPQLPWVRASVCLLSAVSFSFLFYSGFCFGNIHFYKNKMNLLTHFLFPKGFEDDGTSRVNLNGGK